MAEIKKFSLTDKLLEANKNEDLINDPSLLGMTSLTFPLYINAMRGTMFTSHLKQFLNLKWPDFPYLFTNSENMIGKYSSGYKKAPHDYKIVKKIEKFKGLVDKPNIYYLFVYDKTLKKYEVIERKPYESLTETFGYEYLNQIIDSYNEGDVINENTVYERSTSYDEYMNYQYGKNVNVLYTLDPYTSEDAAIASRSLCKDLTCIECDEVTINLNNNDYLINKYGDDDNYKPLPDIGEHVSDIIAAVRRQFNNQLLSDFTVKNLQTIHSEDPKYYIDKDVEVIDYVIYTNNEEPIDNTFYKQINKYLKYQDKFYTEIVHTCKKIIDSGEDYSEDIDYLYDRANKFLETVKYRWRDENDSEYSNMKIVIKIKRDAPLTKGCKITG